jgi:hypothetical protein
VIKRTTEIFKNTMNNNFIDVDNVRYVIKKTFTLDRIKNLDILIEMKWFWGADNVIKSDNTNKLFMVQKVDDAVIIEYTENE